MIGAMFSVAMPYAIGIVLALLTALFARTAGFDRDRAVYPTILIVIASYYVLFAVMGGSRRALSIESVVMTGFALVAVLGFATNLWWVVAALAGHGVFDFVHGRPGGSGSDLAGKAAAPNPAGRTPQ